VTRIGTKRGEASHVRRSDRLFKSQLRCALHFVYCAVRLYCAVCYRVRDTSTLLIWGGRSHFFRLWLRSCSKIFESGPGSGSGTSSNLRIRLLFRLRLQSLNQPKFTHVIT